MLIRITSPYFCCGVVLNDRIVNCAPIVRYMMGWSAEHFYDYCMSKRWELILMEVLDDS